METRIGLLRRQHGALLRRGERWYEMRTPIDSSSDYTNHTDRRRGNYLLRQKYSLIWAVCFGAVISFCLTGCTGMVAYETGTVGYEMETIEYYEPTIEVIETRPPPVVYRYHKPHRYRHPYRPPPVRHPKPGRTTRPGRPGRNEQPAPVRPPNRINRKK